MPGLIRVFLYQKKEKKMGKVFGGSPKIEMAPTVVSNDDAEKTAEDERKKALERQRRGMDSTIKTSYNGVFDPKNMDLTRKKLLGE